MPEYRICGLFNFVITTLANNLIVIQINLNQALENQKISPYFCSPLIKACQMTSGDKKQKKKKKQECLLFSN
jgi:hypothetical protein